MLLNWCNKNNNYYWWCCKWYNSGLGADLDAQGKDVQDVGYVSRSPDATATQTLTVTVATKTTEHTAYGDGSSSGYVIDGHEGVHLQLTLVFTSLTTRIVQTLTPIKILWHSRQKCRIHNKCNYKWNFEFFNDFTQQLQFQKSTPSTLHYQCSSHGNMGGVVSVVGSEITRVTENLTVTGHVLPKWYLWFRCFR